MATISIALILPHLRPGGAETVMVRIANGLSARGVSVALIAVDGDGPLRKRLAADIQVFDLRRRRVRTALLPLLRCLRSLHPRAALSTLGRMNLLMLLARPLLGSTRVLIREANTPSADLARGGHGMLTRCLYPILYPYADTIVCQSEFMRKDIVTTLRVAPDRLVRIYNPAPRREIAEQLANAVNPFMPEEIPLVVCARLARSKGLDLLIDGMPSILAVAPEIVLHVLGDGEQAAALQSQVRGLAIGHAVRFHGYLPDRYRYFKHARLVISPSRWEGLPNVLLEAIACGTPVVATDCPGGTREIVKNGVNGWLVPAEDAPALANTIGAVLQGRIQLDRAAVSNTLIDFDEDAIVDQYIALFEGRIGGAVSRRTNGEGCST